MSEQDPTMEDFRRVLQEELGRQADDIRREMEPVRKLAQANHRAIKGNGDKGIETRLALVEEFKRSAERHNWHVRGLWGTVLVGGLLMAWDKLFS